MEPIKVEEFPMDPTPNALYEILPNRAKVVASTNRLFNKYPTRYISAVPRFAINKYTKKGETIIDPFCGSGTTAIESLLLGRNAISIDIDPFARLLIKVKTTVYDKSDYKEIDNVCTKIKSEPVKSQSEYVIPDIPNIDKWFCERSIIGLCHIKKIIDDNTDNNSAVRDYLYVVMAGIIRKVSNADAVSPKPYISTRYPKTPEDPFDAFFKTEELYRDAIKSFSESVRNSHCHNTILNSNDARIINTTESISAGITSPPYINAYDYVRSLKFENLWLGLSTDEDLRKSRKKYFGSESTKSFYDSYTYACQSDTLIPIVEQIAQVDVKRANMVLTYFEDMAINMISVREALKNNGIYVIVVSDSKIRGEIIPTGKILTEIGEENGYKYELSFDYVIRDRYLHLPRGGRGGIMKYDEILVLKKQ